MAELLDLGVRDLVVALVGIGALALGDAAALDVLLDQLGNLIVDFNIKIDECKGLTSILVKFIDSSPTL